MQQNPYYPRRIFFLGGLAGIILLTLLTAVVQNRNTRKLIDSRSWVLHTHEVLSTLQLAEQSVNQISDDELLYRATNQSMYWKNEIEEKAKFSGILARLAALVQDNPEQEPRAQNLIAEFETQNADKTRDSSGRLMPISPDIHSLLSWKIQQMRTTEQHLLESRLITANHAIRKSSMAASAFLGITVAIIIALFLLLWRDTLQRSRLQVELQKANQRLLTTVAEMQRNAQMSAIAAAASEELRICIEPQESYNVATRFFAQLVPGSSGSLALINNSRHMVETVSIWGDRDLFPEVFPPDACCALRSGRQRWHSFLSNETPCNHHMPGTHPEFYFCLPLAAHGETLGAMLMQFPSAENFAAARKDQQAIEEMGEMVAMAVANLNLRQKLSNQSIRDGLTGLFNRQFLEIAFERELHRAARYQSSISIFMIDVDHFKQMNDKYGHEAGDAILRELAKVMQKIVRTEDIVCRYGGEEFVIILPDLAQGIGTERAEVLRKAVEVMQVDSSHGAAHQITISIGTATYPRDGATPEKLLRVADENLYTAKRQGRNRVVTQSSSHA